MLIAVRIRLDEVLYDRRMSLAELSDRIGVPVAKLSLLRGGQARALRLTTLDALCRALDCQPGDLLAYTPGPQDPNED